MTAETDRSQVQPEAKISFLLTGLRSEQSRKEVCQRCKIPPQRFQEWQEEFIRIGRQHFSQHPLHPKKPHKITPDEQVQIILMGLRGSRVRDETCDRYGISATEFHDQLAALVKTAAAEFRRKEPASLGDVLSALGGWRNVGIMLLLLLVTAAVVWYTIHNLIR